MNARRAKPPRPRSKTSLTLYDETPSYSHSLPRSQHPCTASSSQPHTSPQPRRALPPHRNNHIPQRPRPKPGLTIRKIVLPFTSEKLDISLRHALVLPQQRRPYARREIRHKLLVPAAQRARIVRANVGDGVDNQRAARAERNVVHELADSRQVSAGENVAPDEVVGASVRFVAL